MVLRAIHSCVLSVALCAGLIACGGGGDDPPAQAAPSAEGAYFGTLSGAASNAFQMVVLENGEYWALYGNTVGSTLVVAGFLQGTGTSSNGSFASTDGKDFGDVPPPVAVVNATYQAGANIQGTVRIGTQTANFSGVPAQPAVYTYATAASIGVISGNWRLTTLDGTTTTLAIATTGAATGVSDGCPITGNFAPRPSGKNVFDVVITFSGAAACALPNQSVRGVAITTTPTASSRQLLVGLVDANRTVGDVAFGSR